MRLPVDPTNYYSQPGTNGPVLIIPTITIVSGNDQTSGLSALTPQPLVVSVTNSSGGAALNNAPVTFSVTTSGGLVVDIDTHVPASTYSVRTNNSGYAQVLYQQPGSANVTSQINAVAANQLVSFSEISETPTVATPTFSPAAGTM